MSNTFTALISAGALRDRLGDPKLVVVDCRHSLQDFSLGQRLYDEGHVPGAFFASVEDDLAGKKTGRNGRHPIPDPEVFARFLRELGVDDDSQIVAYDAGGDMFAARLWFLSRWIGHDAVAVLDGGFAVWQTHGYPISAAPTAGDREGNLHVRLRPELVVDAEFVRSCLRGPEMQLLDARAPDRFAGENETIDPVAGHIPGASNYWFKNNFNEDGTFKTREQLRSAFSHLDSNRVVHQCGSGVSSAANQLAMVIAGLEGSRIYGGSWSEWIADTSRPIATGPAP
ncbi:MAG: sulfurtransferase [Candidatus Eremiobacteraeota bacterium]|nr:sulfurtransferase [Candidatus Eremiobacteraeota bacterium]